MKPKQAAQKTIEVCRRQHKSLSTERTYVHWLKRYMSALGMMPAELSSEQKLERFLSELALRHDVSASTQNQAFNAVCFFYKDVLGKPLQSVDALRATRPERVRHAPSVQETRELIKVVRNVGGYPTNLITRLLYGCGLRVTEPLNLRIKDVLLTKGRLVVRGAKGRKDRVVAIPCSLVEELTGQVQAARAVWQRDQKIHLPIALEHRLAAKYPEYQFAWPWAWLFPSRWPCKHPHTGQLVR